MEKPSSIMSSNDALVVPNLFLIGVPKGGTTTLATWLQLHPDVSGGITKELRFLMDPTSTQIGKLSYGKDGIKAYSRLFPDVKPDSIPRYLLDASPQYYYQETARKVIPQIAEDVRVVLVFREPARRIYSLYRYAQNNQAVLARDIDFRGFLSLVRDGDPQLRAERPMLADSIEHSRYATYVQQWQEVIPEGQLRFMLMEDLVAAPYETMRGFCTWLGIDATYYSDFDFPAENVTYQVRSLFMHKLMIATRQLGMHGRFPEWMKSVYYRLNTNSERIPTSSDDQACIKELASELEEDNTALARLTGLDLSVWAK